MRTFTAAMAVLLLAAWPAAAAARSATVSLTINLVGPANGSVAVIPGGLTCGRPGSSSCTVSFAAGTRVDLVANSLSGSASPPGVFSGGTGSAAGCATSTCTFAIDTNSTVTTTFNSSLGPFYSVTVTLAGDGQGSVGIGNSSRENYDPPTANAAGVTFAAGSVVSIGADAAPESRFSGYSAGSNGAAACAAAAACSFTLNANTAVTATFHAIASIAVTPSSAAMTTVETQTYDARGTYTNGVTESLSTGGFGVWRTKGQLSTARYSLAAAAARGQIYAIGGVVGAVPGGSAGAPSAATESFDPAANAWTARAAMTAARAGHAGVTVDDFIYVFGGYSSGSTPIASVERYDPAGNAWTTRAPMPAARKFAAAAAVNGIVYVTGGETSSATVATVEAYDPVSNSWVSRAPMNTARRLHAAVARDGILYVMGGIDGSGASLSSVEAYDPVKDTWVTTAALLSARARLGAAAVDGMLYVIGGDESGASATTNAFDAVSGTGWGVKKGLLSARAELAVASLNGVAYAVGGKSAGGTTLRSVEAFTDCVRWISSDSAVARITQATGNAEATGAGQATITAAIGSFSCAVSGTCATLTVTRAVMPAITAQPAGVTITAGQNATFTVAATGSPSPTYQWQISSNGGSVFDNLVDGSGYSGATTQTLSLAGAVPGLSGSMYRAVARNSLGTATSNAATLIVLTPAPPTATLDRAVLAFAATRTATALSAQTPDQRVALNLSTGSGTVTWAASSNRPWLTVTPASGSGRAILSVGVRFDANLPASGPATGSIAISLTGAANPSCVISVTLSIADGRSAPFGSFDTPAGDTTVLAGSIAVTGWALDDVGVNRVEIWRDLQPGEPTPPFSSTPNDPRTGKVFIANGVFVDGARPDVEALYPATTPIAYRAGWGYLLLTWGLANHGNGTYKLYAFAFDQENNVATLGAKTIIVSNATATRPFGSIDTPAIGGDAGAAPNFGWALTPLVNGAATCRIPSNGVQVSIDSGPLQPVAYGDERTDIAGAFPGFSNSTTAGGHFIFDWTNLRNGAHTIGWLVTDDCGRADGIGSRFFTVTTGTNLVAAADQPLLPPSLRVAVPGASASLAAQRESDAAVMVARGYGELPLAVDPGLGGSRTIELKQGERIELRLPRGYDTAVQIVGGQARALPAGASWDAASGTLFWQPAAGFLGRYRIVFSNGAERISLRIVVTP